MAASIRLAAGGGATGLDLLGDVEDLLAPGGCEREIRCVRLHEVAGRKWEDAARKGKLTAEVVVSPWGKAKLKRVVIDPE